MLRWKCFITGLILFYSSTLFAHDYLQHPKFLEFLDDMEKQHKMDRYELVTLFADVKRKKAILQAIARPAEKTKTWAEYRPIFLQPQRINQGVEFWQKHEATLNKAQQAYGIPPEIIVAIIGVETKYGNHKGNYRVLDSLSTLAFDYPPRAKFFRGQLEDFLLLAKEAGIDPKTATGSYAGAMGYPQFIPSSYRHYAVDFDHDGKTDLLNNPVDAIGSVANYFKKHGWRQGEEVVSLGKRLTDGDLTPVVNLGLKPKFKVGEIAKRGLVSEANFADKAMATAWQVEGEQGPEYWIGLYNFYVITRYNHSHMYAMAVYQLSQEIKKQREQSMKQASVTQ